MNDDLPDGWTIERLRLASGDDEAAPLTLDRLVVLAEHGSADYEVLRPDAVLSFHDLCLARADGEWYMGLLEADGSVVCWSSYGPDLAEAVRAL
ncbi:hypothetical protein [Kitasatospora sp. NPDC101183]|uniref:hypothetical protein n=1 Tax=Kitasatospora sp. NPDC101183 TaxID=3364100 RepID=UPI003806AE4C